MSEIVDLTYDECEKLLRAGVFGRFVLTRPTGPEVVPVNYVTVEDAVLVRTTPGSLLDRYAEGTPVVFQVDHADYERWHGWSVVARGPAERVTPEELTEEERRVPGPPRWVTRDDETWVRLRWITLTGRRVGAGRSLLADLPVRRAFR